MQKKIRIGITDDHSLFRKGMAGMLNEHEKTVVTLEACNGIDLMNQLTSTKVRTDLPEVLLLDLHMPEMDGFAATKLIAEKYPKIKIVILTSFDSDGMIFHLIENGASAFLAKNTDLEILVDTIKTVRTKGYCFNERVGGIIKRGAKQKKRMLAITAALSERETDVLKLICAQRSAKEIAEELNLSPRTVETHRKNILIKTKTKNTAGIVLYAITNNLIENWF